MKKNKIIVEIRKPKLSDAKALKGLINNKELLKQLCDYPYPCPLKRMEKDVEDGIKGWKTKKSFSFTILVDGEIAGSIILENPSKDKGRYDLGFFVGRKFWSKGIATEAIKQIVKFGFDKLKLYRIQADNDSDNLASGRAMERAGFKLEGVLKKIQKKKTKFIDLHMWGITK
ncbi:GNAT family N-acetyltransferase [Candidatus Pacearchaeota archaeon]|nr:GNAT family N-acetyltransferase [Candidatus Pacearchaeota archaeon]